MNELKTQFQMLAHYNQAMNAQLYAACSQLSDEERRRDGGAWFKSIHGTLNHLLLTDKVWLSRFGVEPFVVASLDTELFGSWDEMRQERERVDAEIISWIDNLPAQSLRGNVVYTPMSRPGEMTSPLWLLVSHLWNHQAHHRGQATTLMNALGADSGVTDLIALAPVADFATAHPL